ncbi:SH3 domain-containing protein [Aeromonas veronii]|uniref:SH3 domain-containing protein n=1 Tax=Aeromonas veronii TaxID=654 RepID=UPI003B9F75C8
MTKKFISIFERLDEVLKPYRALHEQIDQILEPQRRLQEQIDKFLEPQLRFQKQMEKYFEPHRKLQDQMQRYLEPHRRLQEQLDKYLQPQRQLQVQIDKYLEPYRLFEDQVSKHLKSLNRYLSDPMMDNISINKDGAILIAGEVVDVEQVENTVAEIAGDYSSPEEFFNTFFKLLEKLGNAARIAVIYLVFPYFLSIVANLTTPIYEEWWKEYSGGDRRVAKNEIIREANEAYRPEELNGYRFVYVTILHVRSAGSINSDIIDELYLGKTVKIIEKVKRWSHIEYQDSDSGELKQGWVFSRYLETFRD